MNDEVLSINCTLKMPGNPKIRISNFTATNSVEGTNVRLNVTNPEGVIDYVMDGDGPSVTAKFYVDGRQPEAKTISRGTDGTWYALLFDGSSVPTGDTLKIVLEHDPAKTQFDPSNAEETTVVTAE